MSDEMKKNKRRPGRDPQSEENTTEASFSSQSQASMKEESVDFNAAGNDQSAQSSTLNDDQNEKVRIEFYGSELLRMKAPKAFDVLDTVATDWKNDGDFKALPVGHPLLQVVASEGLTRAKKIEKKLEEKGVLPMLRIGLDYAKSKILKK